MNSIILHSGFEKITMPGRKTINRSNRNKFSAIDKVVYVMTPLCGYYSLNVLGFKLEFLFDYKRRTEVV